MRLAVDVLVNGEGDAAEIGGFLVREANIVEGQAEVIGYTLDGCGLRPSYRPPDDGDEVEGRGEADGDGLLDGCEGECDCLVWLCCAHIGIGIVGVGLLAAWLKGRVAIYCIPPES